MQQFSVTLGQCVDEDPNDPSDARAPSLIVRGASYGTETITAGSPFTLSLTLYASNGTESVADVVASLTLPEGVTMTGGNLSSYVGTMAPQSSSDVSFSIQTSAGSPAASPTSRSTWPGRGPFRQRRHRHDHHLGAHQPARPL